MLDENFHESIEGIREFAVAATNVGQAVAHFGLTAAYFTPIYREPGIDSIDEIDSIIGSEEDVEGPLLAAHRLAKFYVISSGDALLSACDLVGRDFPMHVGSGALARVAAEHAAKAMFLADPAIDWRARVLRTYDLFRSGLQEYRSSNDEASAKLIDNWKRWRHRTGSEFADVPKQPSSSSRKLIEAHFGSDLGYDELSRPTHGNAVWMTLAVIQEQKGTNFMWSTTLRNVQFAMDVCISASDRLCRLWNVDHDEVLVALSERRSLEPISWKTLCEMCDWVRGGVEHLSANVVVDWAEDPQPPR